ncbi:MAG: response regulator [Pseudomonadota bacterium]|nr:response regulator [Pseudomonadota bacterium]
MVNETHFLRSFYEIATSIGGTLDLEIMCRAALNAFHRKLNCHSSALICASKNEHYLYIATGNKSEIYPEIIKKLKNHQLSGLGHLLFQELEGNLSHAVFELPNFGVLVLTHDKSSKDLDYLKYDQDLIILNHNLAAAAIACIKNQELRNAELAAQKALKVKSNFLANVSHELRTPMNAIMGFTSLLQRKNTESRQIEFCKRINESANLLMSLINDMLDFNNLENKGKKSGYNTFNLKEEVSKLLAPMQKFAEVKGINFILSFAPETDNQIATDIKRLSQVLTKIVDNAVKFCGDGDTVHVQCLAKPINSETNEYLLGFSITDTGPGIPKLFQDTIFEPFQKDHSLIQNKNQGAGLGLALCKKIISHMGGEIFLQPSAVGCHIEYTWPCIIETTKPINDLILDDKRKRILVVDDNDINRETLGGLLQVYDADICFATNGLEAINKCQQTDYDLIFMDCHMPVMSGLDAVKVIRNLSSRYQRIPIIAVTADMTSSIKEACHKAGMDKLLSKPLKEDHLVELANRFIQNSA